MLFEVTFWIAFIAASRTIAKIYYRRRDVLYGPYCATTRYSKSKADWARQNFKIARRGLEHMRAPVRPDIALGQVRSRVSG